MDIATYRTSIENVDFRQLVTALDLELNKRYGEVQKQFDPHNTLYPASRVVVVKSKDQPIGCGCFKVMDDARHIEVKRMYVDPLWRNKGMGKRILAELEQWAREEQFQKSFLETGINQPEAIHAYQKYGYIIIPNYGPYINNSYSVCMEKAI